MISLCTVKEFLFKFGHRTLFIASVLVARERQKNLGWGKTWGVVILGDASAPFVTSQMAPSQPSCQRFSLIHALPANAAGATSCGETPPAREGFSSPASDSCFSESDVNFPKHWTALSPPFPHPHPTLNKLPQRLADHGGPPSVSAL